MHKATSADEFFASAGEWAGELKALRKILNSTALVEEVKWGWPTYTVGGKNVVGLGAFNSYFGLWFHQGALLKDPRKVLINAQEGVTKAQRQWRMTSAADIDPPLVKKYVEEAIALAKAGKVVEKGPPKTLSMSADFKNALAADKRAGASFKALTPFRQREYADYINEAKRDETRSKRIIKVLPMIAAGIGLNDRYR